MEGTGAVAVRGVNTRVMFMRVKLAGVSLSPCVRRTIGHPDILTYP